MLDSKSLSLVLVVLLAFWTPVSQCCAVLAEAPAPAETSSVPPCHPPQPSDDREPCNSGSGCEDEACHCSPMLGPAGKNEPAASAPTPSYPQLSAATAVLLPTGMLPHTFANADAFPPRASSAPPETPVSLIDLSCQLTL